MNKVSLYGVLAIIAVAFLMNSVECRGLDPKNIQFLDNEIDNLTDIDDEEDPPCICTMEYNPVCSSSMETFSNPCLFQCEADTARGKRANLRILFYGVCEESNSLTN